MKHCQINATNHTPALSFIFNNPCYLCNTKNKSFSGKKYPNFYALYNDRDELLSASIYSQRFYRHFDFRFSSYGNVFFFRLNACKS